MDLRSVAGADTQIYAIGVDIGGMALEVAQPGFSTMLSNRMAGLGRWSFDGPRPTVRLADDLVVHLLSRERAARVDHVVIGVASPVWFGIDERTRLADVIDPIRRHELVACTTTTAAAVGRRITCDDAASSEVLLVLDLEVGCSAAVVQVGPGHVREWCAVGVSPQRLRGESSGAGIVPVSRQRERVLTALFAQWERAGGPVVSRVLAIGDEPRRDVERLLAAATPAWSSCPLEVVAGRSVVSRGAAFLADPVGCPGMGVERPAVDDRDGTGPAGAFEITGVVARRIGVLMEDRQGAPIVHPVVDRGAPMPSVHEQLFDLGPDDGSEVYVDLFEQDDVSDDESPDSHRLVATAHLRREGRSGQETTVLFELGADGRFGVGPTTAWTLDWHGTDVDVVAVRPHLVDERDPWRRGDRSTVRPLLASWPVAPAASPAETPEPAVEAPGEASAVAPLDVELGPEPGAALGPEAEAGPVAEAEPEPKPEPQAEVEPEPEVEVEVEVEVQAEPEPEAEPAPPVPVRSRARAGSASIPPTPAVAAALQRCERLLSSEVGQMVALRSVFALLDLPDDAPPADVLAAADRLERSLDTRPPRPHGVDDLAEALRGALAAARQAVHDGRTDWYFGGTAAEVDHELARVVEHLMIVVGFVSPAEQRRLVLDAQLLGLSVGRAHDRVRDLVLEAQAARLQHHVAAGDDGARMVRLHPELGRFVLDQRHEVAVHDGPGHAGDDAVRMRVLLDVR